MCFCEIAPKSNFLCNGLVQRRHHYHLVNKKHVLPFGHLELNNNHSLNILVTDPFFSLLPIPFCASPKPGTGFPSTNVVVFFFHNHLKRDVVVCFVDISGFY
jgi:hypothetical protein